MQPYSNTNRRNMEDDRNILENRRQPFLKMEDDLNFFQVEDNLNNLLKNN